MASTDFCFHISDLDLPPSSPNLLLDENDNDIDETSFGASFPDLPITYSELYQQLLVGLMEPARVIWWPILPQINRSQSIIQSYPKLKENSLKRYQWVRERSLSSTNNDYLTLYEVYQHRQHEILLLLTEIIDFDIILMKKFVEIIIHIIPSNDICFHLCSTILISRKGYWIGLNYNEHQLNLQIFYEIMKTYLTNFPPSTTTTTSTSTSTTSSITFDLLISCRILDDTFLNHIFLNFFTTILPWCHVLRILDLYLLEGKIILYRFGMGLIYHYLYLLNDNDSTSSNSINFRNGKAFWSEVAIRSKTMKFHDLYETTMSVGNKSFLRSIFSFTSPSSKMMDFHLTHEAIAQYEAQAKLDLQHPLKRRQSLSLILSDTLPSSLRLFNSLLYTSRYLTSTSLSLLFASFPHSCMQSIDHFTLTFATYYHGYSLQSLYKLTSFYSPVILLLRSLEKKAVIGVFLDDSISPPQHEPRGKGKGGIFRLNEEKTIWYGTATEKKQKQKEKETGELQRRRRLSSEEIYYQTTVTESKDSSIQSIQEEIRIHISTGLEVEVTPLPTPHDIGDIYYEYCIAQHDALIFGGSMEYGTNAIRICSDLRTCSCGPSDTYENLSLIPEETDPFIIEDVEVFCGHIAMEDFVERHSV